ncbi:uncharacterized protein LOC123708378 [Pieris brassicae]|uniref:uncharacterized protein LOC123708378 n=1 Tax=Pieris brassicae TaxID=7116 RepID=UPI001E6604DF|nr:uncharacterized protein LOC123708378 [Pieris brassicae]
MFLCVQEEDYKVYLWNYLINVFFKSLPTTYVYAFFSAYVPETHFFVAKIFPIAYGSTIVFIITALIDLIMVTFSTTKYLDYLVLGLRYQSPWNRCSESLNITYKNTTLTCYEIQDFAKQFINKSVKFDDIVYISKDSEHFQLPQLLFYLQVDDQPCVPDCIKSSDFDLLSESMTTPPIVHILSSRSNIDKKPIQDSAFIVMSNAVYYAFRGTLMEVIIIFYLYPVGRLVDDMTFFNGVCPTKLRIFTFWAAPVFYMCWIQMFKPLPNWGPKDYTLRQLRKRYDSRFYITSQTSRELSRYLIEKSELNEYKLDVQYDTLSQQSSQKSAINLELEKNK